MNAAFKYQNNFIVEKKLINIIVFSSVHFYFWSVSYCCIITHLHSRCFNIMLINNWVCIVCGYPDLCLAPHESILSCHFLCCNSKVSSMMLYTVILNVFLHQYMIVNSIHIYIYIYVCIYICICIYMYMSVSQFMKK